MKSNIAQALDVLKTKDTLSMIFFVLFKLSDDPQYSTLSELPYLLEHDDLIKLLNFYGGLTIKIPTSDEFLLLIDVLTIYQIVKSEGKEYSEVIKDFDRTPKQLKLIKENYLRVADILATYTFNPR